MTRYVFVGTYTKTGDGDTHRSQGIYLYRMDPTSGQLEQLTAAAGGPDPSFLALHPSGRFLYAVNELGGGQATAFAVDLSGPTLTMLNSESTGGEHPCYISLDPSSRWVLAANYSGGSVCSLPIEADGRLGKLAGFVQHQGTGPNQDRQEKAHAHSILPAPGGRFTLSADLGIDRVWVYRLDAQTGQLIPNDPPGYDGVPGAGPRHLAFHPNGRYLYIANELDSTVTACAWDGEAGTIRALQAEPLLPEDFKGENTAADIHLTPDGRYLYASNRGHESLAAFRVDGESGRLAFIGHFPCGGQTPRNFAIDPDGRFLLCAHQDSNSIVVFRIDAASGRLEQTGVKVELPMPVCVVIRDM